MGEWSSQHHTSCYIPASLGWDEYGQPVVSLEGEGVLWDPYPPPAHHPHSTLVTQKGIRDSLHLILWPPCFVKPWTGPTDIPQILKSSPACSLPFLPLHLCFLKRVQEGCHHQAMPSPWEASYKAPSPLAGVWQTCQICSKPGTSQASLTPTCCLHRPP